jgi:heat shock protein HtpX
MLAVALTLTGLFDIATLGVLVVAFNIIQWLVSPYLIGALYRTREISPNENPKLYEAVEKISRKSGMKPPKLMLAQIPIPNAFAYGSPLGGSRIAVTSGILKTLNDGEIEAVIGHELGHLKHRDVQVMMFVSLLPALFYYVGYSLTLSSMYGRRREEGSSTALIGIIFIAFWWVLNLFTLYLSRLREYYADKHSVTTIEGGSQKLSTGLAKIAQASKNMSKVKNQTKTLNAFKALMIADPDRAQADAAAVSMINASCDQKLVQEILSKRLTTADKIAEILSTHPNIIKRLKALQEP